MLLYLLFTSALACLSFGKFVCMCCAGGLNYFHFTNFEICFKYLAHPLQHDEESTKIIGGRNASIYDYPWHVALLNSNTSRHLCAGVIISRYAVLTIAQCVHTGHVDQVRIGTAYRAGGGYTRHIHRIVLHPKFNISISAWDHNIAIIILRNPVYYTPRIRSVALPRYRDDLAINATVTVTGWGWTDEPTETFPDVLQTADIQVIDRETCAERFRGVTDNMLCARHHNLSLVGPCFVSEFFTHNSNNLVASV